MRGEGAVSRTETDKSVGKDRGELRNGQDRMGDRRGRIALQHSKPKT